MDLSQSINKPSIADLEEFFSGPDARQTGIYITNIIPPKQGWPIAMYCSICQETTILLEPYALPVDEGRSYLLIRDMCPSPEVGINHNMRMVMEEMLRNRIKSY